MICDKKYHEHPKNSTVNFGLTQSMTTCRNLEEMSRHDSLYDVFFGGREISETPWRRRLPKMQSGKVIYEVLKILNYPNLSVRISPTMQSQTP